MPVCVQSPCTHMWIYVFQPQFLLGVCIVRHIEWDSGAVPGGLHLKCTEISEQIIPNTFRNLLYSEVKGF